MLILCVRSFVCAFVQCGWLFIYRSATESNKLISYTCTWDPSRPVREMRVLVSKELEDRDIRFRVPVPVRVRHIRSLQFCRSSLQISHTLDFRYPYLGWISVSQSARGFFGIR